MKILNQWSHSESIVIAEVDQFPTDLHTQHISDHIMNDVPMLPWQDGLDEVTLGKLKELKSNFKNQYKLRLAILDRGELVGWTLGWQDNFDQASFFMGASVVLPKYRQSGLYTSLVKKVFDITKEKGFQTVWSMHLMTNNPILIAKLKIGFSITGFEVNTLYGALVKLVYHHSDFRKNGLRFRAGAIGESEVFDTLQGARK